MSFVTRLIVAAIVSVAFHMLIAPLHALPAAYIAAATLYVTGPAFMHLGHLAERTECEVALRDVVRTIDKVLAAEDVPRARKLCAKIVNPEEREG